MSMIDRYKKKGGFVQLLNLMETTGKEKQEKFLKMIADENPAWEVEIRKKMLTVDRILSWNTVFLAEVFPRVQPMQLAMVVGGLPPEKAAQFMNVLTYKEKKGVEDVLSSKKPNAAETSVGITKLFGEIRKMVAEGSLKFEKCDPDMIIAEDIEDQLSRGFIVTSKDVEAQFEAPPQGTPANVIEELAQLRRRMVQLTQENLKLQADNHGLKEKLENIRKVAA